MIRAVARFVGLRPKSALLSAAAIGTIDLMLWWRYPPTPIAAVMDETAHALTALLFLSVTGRTYARATVLAVLAGAVLIDVDHVPLQVFGWDVLARGTIRPYPHSLPTLIACACAWLLAGQRWRPLLAGLGFGVATHLIRDAASVGVPLLWPLTTATVAAPSWMYATLLLASVAGITWQRWLSDHRIQAGAAGTQV